MQGTLLELKKHAGLKAGDIVECVEHLDKSTIGHRGIVTEQGDVSSFSDGQFLADYDNLYLRKWRIISCADKTWQQFSDAEQGSILLAAYRGHTIEYFCKIDKRWKKTIPDLHGFLDTVVYRIKPMHIVKTISGYLDASSVYEHADYVRGDCWVEVYGNAAQEVAPDPRNEDACNVCWRNYCSGYFDKLSLVRVKKIHLPKE